MYKCLECDALFDTPKKYIERHGFDYPPYEEYYGCPGCGGGFEEVNEDEDLEDGEENL